MRFLVMTLTVLAVAGLVDRSAYGSCTDDIQRLQEQGKRHANQGDRKKYDKALQEAQELAKTDEAECLDAVSRARKALNAPQLETGPAGPTQPVGPLNQQ